MEGDIAMEAADEAEEQGEWEEWQEDEEEAAEPAVCFFCDRQLSDVATMLQHCRAEHGGFDFKQLRLENKWDEYERIRVINYIRTQSAAHRCLHCLAAFPEHPALLQHMEASQHFRLPPSSASPPSLLPWGDDAFLRSFLEGDPVLYSFDDEGESDECDNNEGSAGAAGPGKKHNDTSVVDVTGLPLTAASATAAAAAAEAGGGGMEGSEEERMKAFEELLSLVQGEGGLGTGEVGEGSGSRGVGEQSAGAGGMVRDDPKGDGLALAAADAGVRSGASSGVSVGKGKAKVEEAGRGEEEGMEVDEEGLQVVPSLDQYMALANQVLLLRQQNAQLAQQLAARSAGGGGAAVAADGGGMGTSAARGTSESSFSFTPAAATDAAAPSSGPRTPFSTPMVSPSPSSASLVATAAAAATIATAATTVANATDATAAPGADAATAAATAVAGQTSVPRTPFTTPLVSPCPSYASLATAAAAAAAEVEGLSGAGGMHEASVKDLLLQVKQQQPPPKQGKPPIPVPVSPRPLPTGAAGAGKAGGTATARAGWAGGEGVAGAGAGAGAGVEGGGSGSASPAVPRTPFCTPLASPSPSYAHLPLDEAQEKLAAAAAAAAATDADDDGGEERGGSRRRQVTFGAVKERQVTFGAVKERQMRIIDASYFTSYAGFAIHREMLSDQARTKAYQTALEGNPRLVEGATVMDVGCGTGILSLFAARGGAAKVVAVDGSREILSMARRIARDNGYLSEPPSSSTTAAASAAAHPSASTSQRSPRPVVSFVCGKIEDLRPLEGGEGGQGAGVEEAGVVPVGRGGVDVIVSEWMGYALLYESMLPSVLHARDTWLKPGGALLPDAASMHVAGFGESATSIPFWRDVYGFSMAAVSRDVEEDVASMPLVLPIKASDIVTSTCTIKHFDLMTVTADDLDFTSDFHITPAEPAPVQPATADASVASDSSAAAASPPTSSSPGPTACHGLALWFDTAFSDRFCPTHPVLLSTSPFSTPTHWAQTLLTFRHPITLTAPPAVAAGGAAEAAAAAGTVSAAAAGAAVGSEGRPAVEVRGRVSVVRASKHRSIDISLEVTAVSADGGRKSWPAQMFTI